MLAGKRFNCCAIAERNSLFIKLPNVAKYLLEEGKNYVEKCDVVITWLTAACGLFKWWW